MKEEGRNAGDRMDRKKEGEEQDGSAKPNTEFRDPKAES